MSNKFKDTETAYEREWVNKEEAKWFREHEHEAADKIAEKKASDVRRLKAIYANARCPLSETQITDLLKWKYTARE